MLPAWRRPVFCDALNRWMPVECIGSMNCATTDASSAETVISSFFNLALTSNKVAKVTAYPARISPRCRSPQPWPTPRDNPAMPCPPTTRTVSPARDADIGIGGQPRRRCSLQHCGPRSARSAPARTTPFSRDRALVRHHVPPPACSSRPTPSCATPIPRGACTKWNAGGRAHHS